MFYRLIRRISGCYVPHLEPFWDEDEWAVIKNNANSVPYNHSQKLLKKLSERFPESKRITLTDSGTTALYIALKSLKIESHHKVMMPTFCCSSVVTAIIEAGAEPYFVDVDSSLNIDLNCAQNHFDENVFAVVAPQIYGIPIKNLETFREHCKKRGIFLIEDCTQSFGMVDSKGKRAGETGDISIFSGGIGKPLMGPGGGWLIHNSEDATDAMSVSANDLLLPPETLEETNKIIIDFVRRFTGAKWKRGCFEVLHSLKNRMAFLKRHAKIQSEPFAPRAMNDIEAALLCLQIDKAEQTQKLRNKNLNYWVKLLNDLPLEYFSPRRFKDGANCFPVLENHNENGAGVEQLRRVLEKNGIATQPCYSLLHEQPAHSKYMATQMRSDTNWRPRGFLVPIRPTLTEEDRNNFEKIVSSFPNELQR